MLQTVAALRLPHASGETISFLIDTHQKDQRYAFKLADRLSERGVGVEFNQESSDPIKSLTDFEQAVRQVQNLVIMFGKVAPTWLKGRIQTTLKVIAEQLQQDRPVLSKLWIVLLPGCPGQNAVPATPLLRVGVLDNRQAEGIADDLLEQLLTAEQGEAHP